MNPFLRSCTFLVALATLACASKGMTIGRDAGTGTGGGSSTGTGGAGTGGAPVDEMCGGAPGAAGSTGQGGQGGQAGEAGGAGGNSAGGAGGVAGGGPLTITSTEFGAFDNSFLITPCMAPGTGFDCPNRPVGMTSCPTNLWSYGYPLVTTMEASGNSYSEVFSVSGGEPDQVYKVTVQVVGQAEGRTYTGGTRSLTTNVDPNAVNDLLYTGGRPGTSRVDYNIFQLTIAPPKCTPGIPEAPTYYAFNAVDTTHEGQHYNYAIKSMFTFKVKSGYTVTLTSHDSNCIAIKNCGSGGPYNFSTAALCEAAARDTAAEATLPATFRGQTITSPTRFQTQFLNFKVLSITAE